MATPRPIPLSAEAAAHGLSARALSAALGKSEARPELLRELMRRRPATLRQTLESVVADPSRPTELRTIATVGLAGLRDGRSIGALLTAAQAPDPALTRRAFEALGRLGTPETLATLRTLRAPAGPAARSLAFARSLIAYRHGVEGERLALPRKAVLTPIDAARARTLPVARLSDADWAALRPTLQGADVSVAPTARPPLEIRCGADRLLLMVNPLLEAGAPAQALGRPVVAAVLMKFMPTLARWYVAEYFFAHPRRGGAAQLVGTRPSGTVVHGGSAQAADGGLRIAVQALDTPYAAPTQVSASLDAAAGLALQALVEPDRSRNRHRARAPRLASQAAG